MQRFTVCLILLLPACGGDGNGGDGKVGSNLDGGQDSPVADGQAGSDAHDAGQTDAGADVVPEANDGATCIPMFGSCVGNLLCCDGTQCIGEACGVDPPSCAGPGETCGGEVACCNGDPCGAEGKCPVAQCSPKGQQCGYVNSPACCTGLECYTSQHYCFDPVPCSVSGQPCGNGCCQGLACNAGTCEGTPSCALGGSACATCLSEKCCGPIAQCQSVATCGDPLGCIDGHLSAGKSLAESQYLCSASGALVDAVGSCGKTHCSSTCGT